MTTATLEQRARNANATVAKNLADYENLAASVGQGITLVPDAETLVAILALVGKTPEDWAGDVQRYAGRQKLKQSRGTALKALQELTSLESEHRMEMAAYEAACQRWESIGKPLSMRLATTKQMTAGLAAIEQQLFSTATDSQLRAIYDSARAVWRSATDQLTALRQEIESESANLKQLNHELGCANDKGAPTSDIQSRIDDVNGRIRKLEKRVPDAELRTGSTETEMKAARAALVAS